jgi:hypothetical protein
MDPVTFPDTTCNTTDPVQALATVYKAARTHPSASGLVRKRP